jgi:large subunit ribosomal protein L17
MRHKNYKYKVGSTTSHRLSLMRNLSSDLIEHGKIKTTHAKCMAVRGYVEKLITLAKDDTVANRRLAFQKLNNKNSVTKLFAEVGPKFKQRPGGYTRVLKLAENRYGDNAKMSYICLVE